MPTCHFSGAFSGQTVSPWCELRAGFVPTRSAAGPSRAALGRPSQLAKRNSFKGNETGCAACPVGWHVFLGGTLCWVPCWVLVGGIFWWVARFGGWHALAARPGAGVMGLNGQKALATGSGLSDQVPKGVMESRENVVSPDSSPLAAPPRPSLWPRKRRLAPCGAERTIATTDSHAGRPEPRAEPDLPADMLETETGL